MTYHQQMILTTNCPVFMRYREQCHSFLAEPCLFPLWINTFGSSFLLTASEGHEGRFLKAIKKVPYSF